MELAIDRSLEREPSGVTGLSKAGGYQWPLKLTVEVPDLLCVHPQGADFSPGDDRGGHAINCVPLRRRPPAKVLHAAHEAQTQDLGIFIDADEISGVLSGSDHITGHQLRCFALKIPEFS